MTHLTPAEEAAVDVLFGRTKGFLYHQRNHEQNHGWFAVSDVAALFGASLPVAHFLRALQELAASGDLEGDAEGRVRHVLRHA